jgi:hypothetical protein
MNDIGIFILGLMVTIVTLTAVILVGRSEAQDPALNRTGHTSDGD